jgi:anti-sigma B factor antagonist
MPPYQTRQRRSSPARLVKPGTRLLAWSAAVRHRSGRCDTDREGLTTIDETSADAISIDVDADSQPGRSIIRVGGEIDMLTAPALRETLLAKVDVPAADVVLDLDGVSFLASTGLGVLVEAAQRAEAAGTALRLVCSSRAVTRPLELTGLNQLLDVHDSMAALPAPAAKR